MQRPGQVYFVTGTDTGVGKTYASCAILEAARQAGLSTAASKPLAAGGERTASGIHNEDALRLQQHCSPPLSYEDINPLCLEQAVAPHLAASQEGIKLQVDALASSVRRIIGKGADLTLVEGAGGWRVPLNSQETMADLVKALQLPVILVVGMRLGCLNHAMLSVEAIQRDGLKLHAWVANQIDPQMPFQEENLDTLKELIAAPLIARLQRQQASPHLSVNLNTLTCQSGFA
jgi:dethiobiotin synthetase